MLHESRWEKVNSLSKFSWGKKKGGLNGWRKEMFRWSLRLRPEPVSISEVLVST